MGIEMQQNICALFLLLNEEQLSLPNVSKMNISDF
jgi:hypothetical protein